MNYVELVAYLDRHWTKTSSPQPIEDYPFHEVHALLDARAHPEAGLTVVHVTGSKGKGSVSALVSALLTAHGLRCGAFTSPHLISVEERIRDHLGTIGRDDLAARMSELIALNDRLGFDVKRIWRLLMICALEFYRDHGIRHAAVEVGAGGRYDQTNVLDGRVACITPVALEHVPALGYTRAQIAAQKVGIVKPGGLCISAAQPMDVAAVVDAGVALAGGRLVRVGVEVDYRVVGVESDGLVIDVQTPAAELRCLRLNLLGRHQAENAAVALAAAQAVLADAGLRLDRGLVATALAGVRWPGRLEVLRRHPLLMYDGAHTPESAGALAAALSEHFPGRRWTFVIGCLARRDTLVMMRALRPVADSVIGVPVPGFEAIEPSVVAQAAREAGLVASTASSVAAALAKAGSAAVCVTGTQYLYAEAAADFTA